MEAIEKLLATGRYSKKDLAAIYRFLCKHTHPDLAGGDGSIFLKVREAYSRALVRFEAPPAPLEFDPHEIPRELDYFGSRTPRGCLFACLRFYFILGLQSFRVRSNPTLKERNLRVMRSVLHWAEAYDPRFVTIFSEFNRQRIQPMASTLEMKNYTYAKRSFFAGFEWFFQFQETGRDSCRRIAQEKLSGAVYTMEKFVRRKDPLIPLAKWLLDELDLEAAVSEEARPF